MTSLELEQASKLVNSAVSSSHSIKSFPVKWQTIRNKLRELHSALSVTSNGGIPPLTILLQAVSATAGEAELLARHCSNEFYSGGKLLMNSNLDVISTKLELHIKQLNDAYASGVLMNSQAIVLSKPSKGARREDVRLYVKDLFSRIRIGELEMRVRALAAINEVMQEDERYVRAVADEAVDGVSILVNVLEFRDMVLQEEALLAVSVISSFNFYRGKLVIAGVIPPLIHVLGWGSSLAKERAARSLKELTENCNNSWLVSSQGGVMALLKICSDEDGSNCKLVSLSCCVLKNISGVGEIRRFMVEEGVVAVLLKLLKSKDEVTKLQAMEFLYNLASDDETIKQKVATEQVSESLLTVMNPDKLYSWKAREIALRAIEGFFFSSAAAVRHLLRCGFLYRILFFLTNGDDMDRGSALKAASRICRVSEEVKKAMGDAGFIEELTRLLEVKSCNAREVAADALCSLILVQKNRRRFIQQAEGIDRVLQLLDPMEGNAATKKLLLSALMSVTDSHAGRRKVAASVHVKNLEKLAEADMADAKKIVKKISSNRFRSMLGLIWAS